MVANNRFYELFGYKPPKIAMIHLAGDDPAAQALREIGIYEQEKIDAIIVENYHGSIFDVERTLEAIKERGTKLVVGVNILPNEYTVAFDMADRYGAKFIQLDHVAGKYQGAVFNTKLYEECRNKHSGIAVFGGVWPKYYTPIQGSDLELDLKEGMERADAIVVTGEGTGIETSIEKILQFREIIGDFPLIVGAGVTPDNAREQLENADGVIVGSSLKPFNQTDLMANRQYVMAFVDAAKEPINTTYVRNVIEKDIERLQRKLCREDGYFSHYNIDALKITAEEVKTACEMLVEKGFLESKPIANVPELSWYRKI
ncbi:MAG: membrane biogenesis protein [Candidatus Aenigmarchaeota archaeon]|nr:membrane biogenesis protein [Candidatus Aenigmarchaeota archaeon]